jgi:hypothetical protein
MKIILRGKIMNNPPKIAELYAQLFAHKIKVENKFYLNARDKREKIQRRENRLSSLLDRLDKK